MKSSRGQKAQVSVSNSLFNCGLSVLYKLAVREKSNGEPSGGRCHGSDSSQTRSRLLVFMTVGFVSTPDSVGA